MKKLIMTLMLMPMMALASLTDGLVAYLPFDGNANDTSGNGNHGSVNGATLTTDRFGNDNGAYYFDGVDDWIQIANSTSLMSLTNGFTFTAWIRIDEWRTWVPVFCKATSTGYHDPYEDPLYEFKYTFQTTFEGLDMPRFSLSDCPEGGVWTHVTLTFDGDRAIVYHNGEHAGSGTGGAFNSVIPNEPLVLGRDAPGDNEWLKGAMDDVRIYNRVLSAAEVKALYDGTRTTSTMVPGFYRVQISCSDFDSTTSIWNSPDKTVTLYPAELYALECPEYTMYAFASYMWMEGGVTYNFKAGYDDRSTIVVNGETVCVLEGKWGYYGYDCQENECSYTPAVSGWYPVELRAWNRAGEGGATTDERHPVSGFWYNSSADSTWRKFEDAGDGAKFRAVVGEHTVTFDANGGTGGDDYVMATEGQPMPVPRTAPTRPGWAFAGYWDTLKMDANGNPLGRQYYDANMRSVRSWDRNSAATLWAKWTVRVKLGKNGGIGGDDYVTVTYNQPFPRRTMPWKPGYTFGGYWVSSSRLTGQCYNLDGSGAAAMKWTTGGTPTVWALWLSAKSAKGSSALRGRATERPQLAEPGLYEGVLADGEGTFSLLLDEGLATAYLVVQTAEGDAAYECEAEVSDGEIVLVSEDGAVYNVAWRGGGLVVACID